MIFRTEDGTVLKADTAEGIVHQLHQLSLAPAKDDFEWMEQTAQRAWELTGQSVRWGTAAEFLVDMTAARLLSEGKKEANNG